MGSTKQPLKNGCNQPYPVLDRDRESLHTHPNTAALTAQTEERPMFHPQQGQESPALPHSAPSPAAH